MIYLNVHADQDHSLLDREEREDFYVVVVAEDLGGLIALADVKVILKDVNDNPPKFERPSYQAELTESLKHFSSKSLRVKVLKLDIIYYIN